MLVGFFGIDSVSTFTPPALMTEEWDTNAAGNPPSSESAQFLKVSIGSSGTEAATADLAGNWVAQLIALKPDVTAPTDSLTATSTAPAGSAFVSGNTVYYRGTGGGAGGSFQLTNTVARLGVWARLFGLPGARGHRYRMDSHQPDASRPRMVAPTSPPALSPGPREQTALPLKRSRLPTMRETPRQRRH